MFRLSGRPFNFIGVRHFIRMVKLLNVPISQPFQSALTEKKLWLNGDMQQTRVAVIMEEYYRRRARGFDEEFYHGRDSARYEELQGIANISREALKARRVLDLACGTAYWTQIVSETAHSIVGADFAKEMLEIAERKQFECPVSFCRSDAFSLPFRSGSFNGGMADF